MASVQSLRRRINRLRERTNPATAKTYERYRNDPLAYAREVLKVSWWAKQQEVALACRQHRRVMVKAGHGVGKTMLSAGLVNHHFDCFIPSIALTTAPTQAQVVDLLWKEVRAQRHGRVGLLPKAPRMETTPDHYAAGYTARDADSFQGRHEKDLLIVFDEAVGVDAPFWDSAEGMLSGPDCRMLAIFNPTDTTSRAYAEEQSGRWHVITISCLDHPNIEAELKGEPAPYPSAVRLSYVQDALEHWAKRITPEEAKPTDVEFPPGSGEWYRPGPLFEAKVLGRWPSSTEGVWNEALWNLCLMARPLGGGSPEIGCDVARDGDDFTSIHVRLGKCSIHHERHNGWKTNETAGRLKQLCQQYGTKHGTDPKRVKVKIDDDGVGGGVVDQKDGYRFIPVGAGCKAKKPEKYRNRRNELWFDVAERAEESGVDLSRMDAETMVLLKQQAMAPKWRLDSAGRREVEPKAETKKKIKCSPDDMDALNLAYAEEKSGWDGYTPPVIRDEDRTMAERAPVGVFNR